MEVVVERIVVLVDEVIAVDVIDEAVAVVVEPVVGDLVGVHPDVCIEVRVGVVDPGVDHGDDRAIARDRVPRLRRVDVRIGDAASLALVVETPLLAELGIVRDRLLDRAERVWLHDTR